MAVTPVLAIGLLSCTLRQSRHESSTAPANLRVFYPPDKCVWPSNLLQVVLTADDPGARPKLTLDGKPLKTSRMQIVSEEVPPPSQPVAPPTPEPETRNPRPEPRNPNPANASVGSAAPVSGAPVFAASAIVSSGRHTVTIARQKVRIFVPRSNDANENGNDDAPAGWPTFHLHPPPPRPGKPVQCSACHVITETQNGKLLHRPKTPDVCLSCHKEQDFELAHMHRVEVLSACQMCHHPHGSTADALLKAAPKTLCTDCHE